MAFTSILKQGVHRLGRKYIAAVCESEFASQKFTHHNERPIEYGFALRAIAEHRPKTVCDVGTGTTAFPHLLRNCGLVVTAIDNVRDYWPAGMVNRHWPVLDADVTNLNGFAGRQFDAVTCISVLEHIADQQGAIENIARLLNPGSLFVLTTPYSHRNPCENVYKRDDALYGKDLPYPCRSHSESEFQGWLRAGFKLDRAEYWDLFTGPVWATGERKEWRQATVDEPHQLGCFALVRV